MSKRYKIIRVIRWKGKYIKDFEYSQGQLSEDLTSNPLHALDLATTEFNAAFAWQLYVKRGGKIESHRLFVEQIPTRSWLPKGYPQIPYGWKKLPVGRILKATDRFWNHVRDEWELVSESVGLEHDGSMIVIRPDPKCDHPAFNVCNVKDCRCCKPRNPAV
jgi:hypothetical protein